MNTKLIFSLSAISLFAGTLFGENAVFNASFEMGTDGFALERRLRPDTNPNLEFKALTTDEGAPGAGKKSLKIANPYAESFKLFSKEFRLKPGTEYRISAKMRASENGPQMMMRIFKVDNKWFAHGESANFKLTKDWREYSYEFTTQKPNGNGWYHINIGPKLKVPIQAGDIFIDDIRITEENDPAVGDKVDAVAVSDRNLYQRGEKARLMLKLWNPSGKTFEDPVKVAVTDEYTKKTVFKTEIPVKLASGETLERSLDDLQLDRYGGFRITVSGKGLRTHDGFFAVFGPYEAKPFDPASDCVVAFDVGEYMLQPPDGQSQFLYRAWNAPLERRFEIYAQMGCRMLRDSGGLRWRIVQPEKGKFDFSLLDRQINLYEKYNITFFPIIGSVHLKGRVKKTPEWAKLTKVQPDAPNCRVGKGRVYMPDDGEYYTYIHESAKHLKGRVPFYEFINEPNLYLSPENYVRELKIAHDAIRKADPDAKIVGFCLSTDFNADGSPWLNQCAKLGGFEYADVFSFHPYSSRQLGSLNPADQDIIQNRKTLKRYGKPDMPLWNSELFYLADGSKEFFTPNYVAARFLIDLGEGVTQSISLVERQNWKRLLTPNMRSNQNYHELIPSEIAVACNTMARLFERAKPVGKYRYESGVICYVFRDQHKKLIAGVWNYQGRIGLSADLSSFRVMDFFGNEEKAEIKLLKKDEPYFLTQGKLSEQEFLEKIKNLELVLENPISSGKLGRLAGDTLFVMLHNASGKSVETKLGLKCKGLIARKTVKVEIPAKEKTAVEIPVKIKSEDIKDAVLMLQINGNFFSKEIQIVRNTLIKGSFEGKNFKGTLKFGNGEINMNLTVQDATDAGSTGERKMWETDCVELFFDTDPQNIPERFAQTYNQNTFHIFITPRDGKLTAQGIDPAVCKHSVKCEKDSYTIELSLPAKTGKYLGFECKITDYDAAGKRIGGSQIGKGTGLYKNRCSFGVASEK